MSSGDCHFLDERHHCSAPAGHIVGAKYLSSCFSYTSISVQIHLFSSYQPDTTGVLVIGRVHSSGLAVDSAQPS